MFKSWLFLVFLSLVSSDWICDLEGGESCDTSLGDEIITEGFEGAWISHKTQLKLTVSSRISCAFACGRRSCALYIYTEESMCILALPDIPRVPVNVGSARHINLNKLTNVALGKTIYGSSVNGNWNLTKENAVDGMVEENEYRIFSVNSVDADGWFIVDLESEYVIRAIRIFGGKSHISDMDSTIFGGNQMVYDGLVGRYYKALFSIKEKRPSIDSHYFVSSFINTEPYRYVAMKKKFTPGILQLAEFEVYA